MIYTQGKIIHKEKANINENLNLNTGISLKKAKQNK